MSAYLVAYLGGFHLPDQVQLIETTTPNDVDVRTLGGDLYTDFVNIMRSWTVAFDALSVADYNSLRALYLSQFENETYLAFECDALGINTLVKMDVSPTFWQWSGQQVGDGTSSNYFTLTLTEAYAIS